MKKKKNECQNYCVHIYDHTASVVIVLLRHCSVYECVFVWDHERARLCDLTAAKMKRQSIVIYHFGSGLCEYDVMLDFYANGYVKSTFFFWCERKMGPPAKSLSRHPVQYRKVDWLMFTLVIDSNYLVFDLVGSWICGEIRNNWLCVAKAW